MLLLLIEFFSRAVAVAVAAAACNWSLWWTNARPAHPHPSGASAAANSAFHFAETRLVSKCYTGCRQFSCYFESAKSQVLKRFIFLHTDLQLQRCPSVRQSSFPLSPLLWVPCFVSLSLFRCVAFFFLICCKFLIKKFRFNAAIDCTFCRHHHNNLLTHLALSALATLHLFRLNFSYLREVWSYES